MTFGLDYVSGPAIADMKAAGVAFVCRYVGYFSGYNIDAIATPQGKVLTPGEAKAYSAAGIALVSNWEWYANRAIDGATAQDHFNNGAWDAQEAAKIHTACGGAPSRPIYFSIDMDVDGALVADYFRGVASTIGKARTGAYGSFRVLRYLFDNGLISWGWQTYAWSGGAWESRAHIQQYQNGVAMSGHSVDYNRSIKTDFGQWVQGGSSSMIPTGWHDDGTTLTAPNGVHVVHGFRSYVLAHNWASDNLPLAPEFGAQQLEAINPSTGGGTCQYFRWVVLEYTQARGVFEMWVGGELLWTRNKFAETYNAYQQATQQIQSLQAQLAAAQKPQVVGVDPNKIKSFQQAMELQAHDVVSRAKALETALIVPQ
jgi:hypothetical protein